jgi:regulatory protein
MTEQVTLSEAKVKLEAYCAYQERCEQEIRQKIYSLGIFGEDVDFLVSDLISNNFLNEQRFAEAFVSGKFRIKKWGRIKIKQHLKQKNISDYSIKKEITKINSDEYWQTLVSLAESKNKLIRAKDNWDKRIKLQRYLHSKGYEGDLIQDAITEMLGPVV